MAYADFEYYRDNYFGRMIQEEDFPRFALRASQYIDYITYGMAAGSPDSDAVKQCCCALAEKYQTVEAAETLASQSLRKVSDESAEVQSESVGGHSVSYRSGGDSAQSAQQAAKDGSSALLETARQYLAYTGLLYRGGGRCR